MSITVRPIEESERAAYTRVVDTIFGGIPTEESVEGFVARSRKRAGTERLLAAFDNSQMVATTGSFPAVLTLEQGRRIDVAWIVAVATLPSHRRRGLMSALLTEQLHRLREQRCSIATLASVTGNYRRLGFGVSAAHADVTFDRRRAITDVEAWSGKVDFTEAPNTAELSAVHDAWASSCTGEITRDAAWWDYAGRKGRGYVVLRSTTNEVRAWASYRTSSSGWVLQSTTHFEVEDVVSVDAEARRALWSVILGFDAADTITARSIPLDDQVFRMSTQPAASVQIHESPWLRVLDVPTALCARDYHSDFAVNLKVRDSLIEANDTAFRFESVDGVASCEVSDGPVDVTIDIADLGSALTGHASFLQLLEADCIDAHIDVVKTLDRAFRPARAPFCSLLLV